MFKTSLRNLSFCSENFFILIKLLSKFIKLSSLFLVLAKTCNAGELIKFEAFDSRLKQPSTVLAEMFIPLNSTGKIPVIITQHGSTQSESFENGPGRTDEFSKEVVKQGVAAGFAVVTIDVFYKKGLTPSSKDIFPNAAPWAYKLKNILSNDPRFDNDRMFFTGFSYGGEMVIAATSARFANRPQWRAVASAEPGCGFQPTARKLPYPILFIKTANSHYPPAPCIYLSNKFKESGTESDVIVIPNANHTFSSYGTTIRNGGIATNGCTNNPVVYNDADRSVAHADGTPLTKSGWFEQCVTNTTGGGGNPDKLSLAVNYIIAFFNKNK